MSATDRCPWEGFVYHFTRCEKCRVIAEAAGWTAPNPEAVSSEAENTAPPPEPTP